MWLNDKEKGENNIKFRILFGGEKEEDQSTQVVQMYWKQSSFKLGCVC